MSSRYAGIARRVTAKILESIDPTTLHTLWYENADGEKFIPDLSGQMPPEIPEGYLYQVSRFPTYLTTDYLKMTTEEEVEACDHPDDWIEVDHGLLPEYKGRRCKKCWGYQSKLKAEPWPEKWDASGSRDVFSMNCGWQEDLVLALVNKGLRLSEAIIIAAESCEACMNVLAYECGLDWGYKYGSEEWEKCGTSCGFCSQVI